MCSSDLLADIARSWGSTVSATILELQPAGALYFMMDEADVDRILTSGNAMIGSDGLPGDKHPHPRLWGTFPRVLGHYVRDRRLLTLEAAVHRMTGLTAQKFGIRDRGLIRIGNHADLCVFDPDTIRDLATYEHPTAVAVGIDYVVVNGHVALERGELSSKRAGRVLRRATRI